jgi:hypothetical protein
MAAANRAVTEAARERRLQLVDMYVERLKALNAPSPFDDRQFPRTPGSSAASVQSSAFNWSHRA